MSAPAVSTHAWVDITDLCHKAAAEMTNQAPMISIPDFSLMETMSAVEVSKYKRWRRIRLYDAGFKLSLYI